MIEYRTPAQIEEMRPAGRFVADVITALIDAADVGVNLLELDELAHRMIKERGAESCYIDYHPSFGARPFGKVLCTSVNDAVLHGLPHDYTLQDGDLLSVDFAASVDGWVSDSAYSLVVGTPRPEDLELIDVASRALDAAIDAARVGNQLGDVSNAIGEVARAKGLKVNLEFGGHGVGRTMHGDPHVPNDGRAAPRAQAQGGARDRDRAVVPAHHQRDLHRPRRLDPPQHRRLPRRAHGAHRRDHRRRPGRADRPRLTPVDWSQTACFLWTGLRLGTKPQPSGARPCGL